MSLLDAAKAVRQNAHAPYSNFKVGAALRSQSGKVFTGCNVENVAYPEGTCAEAGAIAAMVAEGEIKFSEITIVADSPKPITPCGGCRQKLAEFGSGDVLVTMVNMDGKTMQKTLSELLPGAFNVNHMDGVK